MSVRIEVKLTEVTPAKLDRYGKTEIPETVREEMYSVSASSKEKAIERTKAILDLA